MQTVFSFLKSKERVFANYLPASLLRELPGPRSNPQTARGCGQREGGVGALLLILTLL